MTTLADVLNAIPDSFWEALKDDALKENSERKIYEIEWWNNKHYLPNPPNDGYNDQIICINYAASTGRKVESPYKRKLFYPCDGRFSLADVNPVAYFCRDFHTVLCETVPELRYNPKLKFCDIQDYLKDNEIRNERGFPLTYKISDDACILDIENRQRDCLFDEIVKRGRELWKDKQTFIDSIILNKEKNKKESVYMATQALAKMVHSKGFDGLVYQSVRRPIDRNTDPYNLVMFENEELIIPCCQPELDVNL